MLVLTRRTHEKIVFPTINTVIQVVSSKAGSVRLGIEAPADLPIVREEILQSSGGRMPRAGETRPTLSATDLNELIHQVNNRLNATTVGMALLRGQLSRGLTRDMVTTLDRMDQEVGQLRDNVTTLKDVAASTRPGTRRALLVEDDPNECELLAGLLRLTGIEVDTAHDGVEALDYLHQHTPNVVLLDMRLPRCDGPSLVRAIRGNPAHAALKIFAVTGTSAKELGLEAGSAGIDRWFSKPLNPGDLLRELQQMAQAT